MILPHKLDVFIPTTNRRGVLMPGCGMWDVHPSATTGRTRWQRASPRAREEMMLQLKGASLPEGEHGWRPFSPIKFVQIRCRAMDICV